MNIAIVSGNLVKDPNFITGKDGTVKGLVFRMACDGNYKSYPTYFTDVILWGDLMNVNKDKLFKGSKVKVMGQLKNRKNNREEWVSEIEAESLIQFTSKFKKNDVVSEDLGEALGDDEFIEGSKSF